MVLLLKTHTTHPPIPNKPTPPKEETPPGAVSSHALSAPKVRNFDTSALAVRTSGACELNLTQEQSQKRCGRHPESAGGSGNNKAGVMAWRRQTEDRAAAVKMIKTLAVMPASNPQSAGHRHVRYQKNLERVSRWYRARFLVTLHRDRSDSTRHPLPHQRLYLRAAACKDVRLCRDRKTPEFAIFAYCIFDQCVTFVAQSDKVTHNYSAPRHAPVFGFRRSFRI